MITQGTCFLEDYGAWTIIRIRLLNFPIVYLNSSFATVKADGACLLQNNKLLLKTCFILILKPWTRLLCSWAVTFIVFVPIEVYAFAAQLLKAI
jgi:hypothetical protein